MIGLLRSLRSHDMTHLNPLFFPHFLLPHLTPAHPIIHLPCPPFPLTYVTAGWRRKIWCLALLFSVDTQQGTMPLDWFPEVIQYSQPTN